ncbi:MAG: hypothetical protein IT365_06075 [Candidatus Hydrogenedentes bacterium]|nr:hypothetical protein [Candidatus Hydrogenedentota bacterium]
MILDPQARRQKATKVVVSLLLATVLLFVAVQGGRIIANTLREADASARDSAQAALQVEIDRLLSAVPPGGTYPSSLQELPLTYPDGGDASLLSQFEYTSDGKSCTLRTWVARREEWVVVSYPQRDGS